MEGSDAEQVDYPALREALHELPSQERAAEMVEINLGYAQCFLDGDFEGMEEYLVETPTFEEYPRGVRITGREAVRARSERGFKRMIEQLDPRKGEDTHELRVVAFGKDVIIHEFSNEFRLADGTTKRCHVLAVVASTAPVRHRQDVAELVNERVVGKANGSNSVCPEPTISRIELCGDAKAAL